MPWVKYVESVIAPTSISGSGNIIALNGDTVKPTTVYVRDSSRQVYTFGDVIYLEVDFSSRYAPRPSTTVLYASYSLSSYRNSRMPYL